MRTIHTILPLLILPLFACVHRIGSRLPVEELGPPLTRLSRAVDAVAADFLPENSSTTEDDGRLLLVVHPNLIQAATAHDPSLLEPFDGYHLEAGIQGEFGVVLVCTADGSRALLEDAGCTAALDAARYREAPPTPCVFTIDPVCICSDPVPASCRHEEPLREESLE